MRCFTRPQNRTPKIGQFANRTHQKWSENKLPTRASRFSETRTAPYIFTTLAAGFLKKSHFSQKSAKMAF